MPNTFLPLMNAFMMKLVTVGRRGGNEMSLMEKQKCKPNLIGVMRLKQKRGNILLLDKPDPRL